ncbi:MAG TPA: tol-pal system protein YbgF [Usitatibacter sp.]|nr:tol-pal system protein YbgF [Usitatibacter sp.]
MNKDRLARAARIAAAVAFAFFASVPARAGLFDDDEARRRIEQLRQELAQQGKDNEARIQKLEDQVSHIGVVELVQQIEQMNEQIARLRGQIEVLANENQQLQKRQRDFYLDLDSRLKRLEGGAAGAAPPGAAPGSAGTAAPPGAGAGAGAGPGAGATGADAAAAGVGKTASREDQAREMKAYDAASNLFRRNDFSSAVDAFRAFLKDYPDSALAPNASYWIGISYANLKDYPHALAAQQELLAKHPQSAKAPDALLAIAAIQAEQGKAGEARNTLEDLVARYPTSDAAAKARTRLSALRR